MLHTIQEKRNTLSIIIQLRKLCTTLVPDVTQPLRRVCTTALHFIFASIKVIRLTEVKRRKDSGGGGGGDGS